MWGVAGWTKDGKSVLLYDKHDVWSRAARRRQAARISPAAPARDAAGRSSRLTRIRRGRRRRGGGRGGGGGGGGREASISRSRRRSRRTASGRRSPATARCRPAAARRRRSSGLDKSIGGAQKAKNADRMIFTEQTFQEFPDYWVSDATFASPRKITDANPQIADYAWGIARARRLHEQQGQEAAGDAHAAGRLPAGQEVSDARVHLRDAVEHASQFSMPVYDDRPHMSDVREQRLPRARARHRLRDRQAGIVGARLRDGGGEEGDRARLRRSRRTSACRATAGAATSRRSSSRRRTCSRRSSPARR